MKFPFLFGGAFIEAPVQRTCRSMARFPFLFGGAFIEADSVERDHLDLYKFPFLFGGAFIEAIFRRRT